MKGHALYRCGNTDCDYSSAGVSQFRDHQLVCEFSEIQFNCYHCAKQFKHIPTLLEHLKCHGLRRFSCGLCDYKSPLQSNVKTHLKTSHRAANVKLVPVKKTKNNAEEDPFVMVPKNAVFKMLRSRQTKDTFSPELVDEIPKKPDIYRHLVRCSVCDFSSKVLNHVLS